KRGGGAEQPRRRGRILRRLGPEAEGSRGGTQSFAFLSFGSGYTEVVASGINERSTSAERPVPGRATFRLFAREVTFAQHSACDFGNDRTFRRSQRPSPDPDDDPEHSFHRRPQQHQKRRQESTGRENRQKVQKEGCRGRG